MVKISLFSKVSHNRNLPNKHFWKEQINFETMNSTSNLKPKEEIPSAEKSSYQDVIDLTALKGDSYKLERADNGSFVVTPNLGPMDDVWIMDADDKNEATTALIGSFNTFAVDVSRFVDKLPRSFFDRKCPKKKAFFDACQKVMKSAKMKKALKNRKSRIYGEKKSDDQDDTGKEAKDLDQ